MGDPNNLDKKKGAFMKFWVLFLLTLSTAAHAAGHAAGHDAGPAVARPTSSVAERSGSPTAVLEPATSHDASSRAGTPSNGAPGKSKFKRFKDWVTGKKSRVTRGQSDKLENKQLKESLKQVAGKSSKSQKGEYVSENKPTALTLSQKIRKFLRLKYEKEKVGAEETEMHDLIGKSNEGKEAVVAELNEAVSRRSSGVEAEEPLEPKENFDSKKANPREGIPALEIDDSEFVNSFLDGSNDHFNTAHKSQSTNSNSETPTANPSKFLKAMKRAGSMVAKPFKALAEIPKRIKEWKDRKDAKKQLEWDDSAHDLTGSLDPNFNNSSSKLNLKKEMLEEELVRNRNILLDNHTTVKSNPPVETPTPEVEAPESVVKASKLPVTPVVASETSPVVTTSSSIGIGLKNSTDSRSAISRFSQNRNSSHLKTKNPSSESSMEDVD
jgi:hypothetical protein